MKKPSGFQGFEIDLWKEIARRLHLHQTFVELPFTDLLPALAARKIDVALGGITMTPERETTIDFSHSTFDSGLQIVVPARKRFSLGTFFSRDLLKVLGIFVLFVLVAAHVIWFAERNGPGSLNGPYAQGIWNAVWYAIVTVSTIGYGDYTPVTPAGRFLGVLVILGGISVFGIFIAQITSSFTERKLRSAIGGPGDLRGKRVGTQEGTVSADALEELGAIPVLDPQIDRSYERLARGEIDAAVFDAPAILHHVSREGKGNVEIVGDIFRKQHYAIALVQDSPIRERVNQAILELYENGTYQRLYRKWFGIEP
jgi:ABC-type amino acid transport substrate-binding protein